jgi:hypothetical protein
MLWTMIRLRWGLVALATVVVAAVGLFTYTQLGSEQRDVGTGLRDTAHVSAAHAVVVRLEPPSGTTLDPSGWSCRFTPAALCLTSKLPMQTLMDEAGTALTAAGATPLATPRCPPTTGHEHGEPGCNAVYDFRGAHVNVRADGHGSAIPTYLALWTYTPPLPVGTLPVVVTSPTHALKPLATWASINPFPGQWHLTASCVKTSPTGCLGYRHSDTDGSPIPTTIQQACADVRAALTSAGYFISEHGGSPGGPGPAFCEVTSNDQATRSINATIRLQEVDATHVTALATVTAY